MSEVCLPARFQLVPQVPGEGEQVRVVRADGGEGNLHGEEAERSGGGEGHRENLPGVLNLKWWGNGIMATFSGLWGHAKMMSDDD